MKKQFWIRTLLFLLIIVIGIVIVHSALAREADKDALVPSSCRTGCPCTLCDLYSLGQNVIYFLLYIIAMPVAAISILYGGVAMITSQGSEKNISKGKRAISNAIIGLAIAFLAWLVLQALLETLAFRINFGTAVQNGLPWNEVPTCGEAATTQEAAKCNTVFPGGGVPTTLPPGPPVIPDLAEDAAVRDQLKNAGITINKDCKDPSKSFKDVPGGQTCLGGLPQRTIDGLIAANTECKTNGLGNCIHITGGTELGHDSHGVGEATVDVLFSPAARDQLINLGMKEDAGFVIKPGITCENSAGNAIPCHGPSGTIDHIHAEF
jgi:hypothetical protein